MSGLSWSQQKVLVTGAGGFIGSHLAERFVELGARTRALVRYNSNGLWGWLDHSPRKNDMEVIAGDVRDHDSVRQAMQGVDMVFHLAALIGIPYSYHAPRSYVETNVVGTLNVLQSARDLGLRLVVCTSTSEVYGTAQTVPIREDHPLQAQSPYSASKIAADKLAESFYQSFDLPVVTARPFNTYGPRQSARAVIPTIITQVLSGKPVKLGSLEPTRDFNYVADTVSGFVRIAETPSAVGQVLNLGSGTEIAIGELAEKIKRMVGKDVPIVSENTRMRPANSEVDRLCSDSRWAQELLGWAPKTSLDDGLAQTITWIEQNLEQYRVGAYAV